jgi:hypothetical protein
VPTTVGSAQVKLAPSLTGFAQQLRAELRSISTDDLTVSIVPQLNQASYNKITRDLDKLTADRTMRVRASADTRVAAEEIHNLTSSRTVRVGLDVDTAVAAADIRTTLDGTTVTVGVLPEVGQAAYDRAKAKLDRLTADRTVIIRASVDTRVAADEIAALTRNRTSTVRVDADTRVAADEIAVLTRERTLTIRTRTVGGTGGSSPSGSASKDADVKGTLISLAPALAPVAAYLASTLASVAAAGGAALVSVGAFGAALKPQLTDFTDLATAEDKASAAVKQYGASSKQAWQAQDQVVATLNAMPEQTRRAAVGFTILKSDFKSWSDDMSKFTMAPVTQGLAIADNLIPRFSSLVKDSSGQLTRLTSIAGGAIETPGFDRMVDKFDTFSAGALKQIVDETVHFTRLLSEGKTSGPASEFMAYAKDNGPEVRDTLRDIATAVLHVLQGASEAGPSMLTVVDAAAHLVSALPPEFIGRALQLYSAFKLYRLASGGINTVAGNLRSLNTRLTALRTASTAAGGGLAGVRTAIGSLSTGAKIGGALLAVTAVVVILEKLSASSKRAPDVDKMTTAIGQLGRTGKVTGEASRVFGQDFSDLNTSIGRLNGQRSGMDAFNDTMNKVFTLGMGKSNSAKKAAKDVDAVDKSLADLVKNGQPDLAAAALKRLTSEYAKSGKPTSDLTSKLDDYQSALSDAKFEQDLTADSMGLFGRQSQQVQAQLDNQKKSADGLRQSIQALNDVNRAALSAQSDFEQAIDDATKAITKHHHALSMTNGELNLNSQAARDAYQALSDLAAKTDAATAAALDQGKSWETVKETYDRGRSSLIKTASAMGLTTADAKTLANQILKTPDKTAYLTGNISDLKDKVAKAQASLKTVPASKRVAIQGNITQLQNEIRDAQAAIDRLHGKTVDIRTTYSVVHGKPVNMAHEGGGYATGGVLPGYTPGRDVHQFYSRTAGSLHLSGGEAVMRPEWTRAVGPAMVNAWNRLSRSQGVGAVRKAMGFKDGGILGRVQSFATGGVVSLRSAQGSYNTVLAQVNADQAAANAAQAAYNRAHSQADRARAQSELRRANLRLKEDRQRQAAAAKRLAAATKRNSAVQNVLDKLAKNFVKGMTGTASTIQSTSTTAITALIRLRDSGLTARGRKAAINEIALVRRDTGTLTSLAAQRDSVKARIAAANTYATNASDNAKSFAGVTSLPSGGGLFDAKGILSGLNVRLGQIKKFSSNLALLAKRGMNKGLLNQLVQAGPEQGGSYAQALAASSAADLKAINSAQSQIDAASTAYGKSVADSMYDSGKQAGKGFLTGLQSQEKDIEKEMTVLARKVEASIRKELKIKSPSKVTEGLGAFTGEGFLVGFRSKHPAIAASVRSMAALVASAGARSMPVERGQAPALGGQNINHFDLHVSDMPTTEAILQALSRYTVLHSPVLLPGG